MYLRIILTALLSLTLAACGKKSPIEPPKPTKLSDFDETAQVELLWDSDAALGTSKSKFQFSTVLPAVTRSQIIAASENGTVVALNKDTGKVNWQIDLDHSILAGVGEGDGVSVVVTRAGKAIGIDSRTSDLLWEQPITQTVFAPPLVYRGNVVLRTIDGDIVCLDASTGEFLWDAIFDQPPFVVHGSPRPLALENLALFGNAEGRIIAVDLITGFESWQVYLGSERLADVSQQAEAPLHIAGDHLYVADSRHAVVAYSLSRGQLEWRHDRDVTRKLAVGRTLLFGVQRNGTVFSLSRLNGQPLWNQTAFLYRTISSIASVGNYVVVDDGDGYLHVLEAATGNIAARIRPKKRVRFDGFIVEGDRLYVAYKSGSIDTYVIRPR